MEYEVRIRVAQPANPDAGIIADVVRRALQQGAVLKDHGVTLVEMTTQIVTTGPIPLGALLTENDTPFVEPPISEMSVVINRLRSGDTIHRSPDGGAHFKDDGRRVDYALVRQLIQHEVLFVADARAGAMFPIGLSQLGMYPR